MCPLVDDVPVTSKFDGLGAMSLLRHNELDAAMAALVVVQVDERGDPLTVLLFRCKWLAEGIRAIFHWPEQGFGSPSARKVETSPLSYQKS